MIYFAVLREQSGIGQEAIETEAATAMGLYRQLQSVRGLKLDEQLVRCAVNGRFAPNDQGLCEGDEVVFIPPVAGG